MILRVRIVLPDRPVSIGLALSLIGHLLLISLVLAAGTIRGTSRPSRPAMMVRLSAGEAPSPGPPTSTSTESAETEPEPEPETKPKPKSKPKPKPPRRTRADAPQSVATEPEQPTARPPELEEVDEAQEPAEQEESASTDSEGAEGGDQSSVELPEGAGGGVTGFETDDPLTADWYVQLVVTRLSDAWGQRPVLPPGAEPRRAVIAFTVLRDGGVTDPEVVTPSGYAPLDYSALRAVSSIDKLPPLPPQYERDRLSARFVFELVPTEDR